MDEHTRIIVKYVTIGSC